jgi:hypothetical protein
VQRDHPDVVAYLMTRKQVTVPGTPRDMVLFDLTQAATD